ACAATAAGAGCRTLTGPGHALAGRERVVAGARSTRARSAARTLTGPGHPLAGRERVVPRTCTGLGAGAGAGTCRRGGVAGLGRRSGLGSLLLGGCRRRRLGGLG